MISFWKSGCQCLHVYDPASVLLRWGNTWQALDHLSWQQMQESLFYKSLPYLGSQFDQKALLHVTPI